MAEKIYQVAIVYPADPARGLSSRLEDSRFAQTAAALKGQGIEPVAALDEPARLDRRTPAAD